MQYLLGSTARAGKVGPGLWGVWNVLDTAEWNGDYTVDYNVQVRGCGWYSTRLPQSLSKASSHMLSRTRILWQCIYVLAIVSSRVSLLCLACVRVCNRRTTMAPARRIIVTCLSLTLLS